VKNSAAEEARRISNYTRRSLTAQCRAWPNPLAASSTSIMETGVFMQLAKVARDVNIAIEVLAMA
jgi:hypothetical protein